jgi:hypothetical protein
MAMKNVTLKTDDKEFTTTMCRCKKREFKLLIRSLSAKGDEIAKLISEPNFLHSIPRAIEENIDFICETIITPFVDVTNDQLDEMDMVDIVDLLKEILAYNNVDLEKIKNFLRPDPVTRRAIAGMLNFDGVPSTLSK